MSEAGRTLRILINPRPSAGSSHPLPAGWHYVRQPKPAPGLAISILTGLVLPLIPFLLLGLGFLAAGGIIFRQRIQKARTILKVLREGQDVPGRITSVGMNYSVRVNGQHPWIIRYSFQVAGNNYEGQVTTLSQPHQSLKEGKDAYVLYLPDAPEYNAIYPHP